MRGRWAASSVSPAQRVGHLDFQPCEQQASPAARTATVALNWCLRSRRIRRVAQGRTSLPCATPLLLSGSVDGCLVGHPSDDERQIHQQVFLPRQEAFVWGPKSRACWQRPGQSFGRGWQQGAFRLVKAIHPCAFCQCLGHGHLRLVTEVKTQVQGWQTSAVSSQFQTQHSVSMARSARSPAETANPSVKGTSCANAHAAPYVER